MRSLLVLPALLALSSTPSGARPSVAASDLLTLEQAWHACVRAAFDQHSPSRSKLAAELSALDECRDHEDAYVAALMAIQVAEDEASWMRDRPVPSAAAAWLATATAYVVDPVSSWLRSWRRSGSGSVGRQTSQ